MKTDYTFAQLSKMPAHDLEMVLAGMEGEILKRQHEKWALCGRIIAAQEELLKPLPEKR